MRVLRFGQLSAFVGAWLSWSWPDVFVVNWPIGAAYSGVADTTGCMNYETANQSPQLSAFHGRSQ
jgi:hypothetical protein